MGRSKSAKFRDPRGHSLRIYTDVYDSHAWAALGPFDVLAYLALLRELKGFNNGDLSLPLSRAKRCGISHHVTLARALRALCAVGLIAVTRKGGCTKGGQRLPTLYRVTDRECFEVPAKHIEARPATDEWKHVTSREQGLRLIADAKPKAKKYDAKTKALGHPVTGITSSGVPVRPKTTTPRDTWPARPLHAVTMAGKGAKPMFMRVSGDSSEVYENTSHVSPSVPLYTLPPQGGIETASVPAVQARAATSAEGGEVVRRFREGSDCAHLFDALMLRPRGVAELEAMGIANPIQRVAELRKRGYRIARQPVDGRLPYRYVLLSTAPVAEPAEVSL